MKQKSKLIEFYLNSGIPYSIDEIITKWNFDAWEGCHDFVQWVFPTTTKSKYNQNAPILTDDDIQFFKNDESGDLAKRFNSAVEFFKKFLLSDPLNFKQFNHNWLRISRVLQSGRELGFDMRNFYKFLITNGQYVPSDTWKFWQNAYNGILTTPQHKL
jgi:Opioid growth factor receptor (OGFr) conserved region